MVTKLKHLLKIFLTASMAVAVLMSLLIVGIPAEAAPLSPEFDLSRIYLVNQTGHKVALEIGIEGDTVRFEGFLSKQVNLTGEEIQEIAMRVLSEMGMTFLEFKEMQAFVKASLAKPKTMTADEREQFIADITAMLNLPAHSGDVIGLFNKVAAGKSEEEALTETLVEATVDTVGPVGALDAVERSWQTYDKKWQNFEYLNRSQIIIDAFYAALQREIDEYKAEKGYKGVLVFKASAIRSGFKFFNNYIHPEAPLNTQVWTIEIVLDQNTITGEDTLEGALNGELGSLAGHYEGWYKLNVHSQLKNFAYGYMGSYSDIPIQPLTLASISNIADDVADEYHCSHCSWLSINGGSAFGGSIFDEDARATVDWEVAGSCEADLFENGAMVFGVNQERIESISNNFIGLTGKQEVYAQKSGNDLRLGGEVFLPVTYKAVPNQKKVYVEYAGGPYDESTPYSNFSGYFDYGCPQAITASLVSSLNAGGWVVEEYAWDYRIHSPWEDENGTLSPFIMSLVE